MKLGRKIETPEAVVSVAATAEPKEYFPEFHYSGDKPMDIPEEGEMTIRYKKIRETKVKHDEKTSYDCTIEVREILDTEEDGDDSPSKKDTSAEDALDQIRAKKMKNKPEDY